MSDLRITGMDVHLVSWPLKMTRRHGVGDIEQSMPGVIVKLTTDQGLVGWGEAAPWSVFTGTAEGNAQALHVYLRHLVVGSNPLRVTSLMRAADKAVDILQTGVAVRDGHSQVLTGPGLGVEVDEDRLRCVTTMVC